MIVQRIFADDCAYDCADDCAMIEGYADDCVEVCAKIVWMIVQ